MRRAAVALILLTIGCGRGNGPTSPPAGEGVAVLVGAGDIGMCGSPGPAATAALLDGIPGTIFTTGDNAYDSGTPTEFRECYDPTWGRHKDRTRPSPGNHDYRTPGASGYFAYFGNNAGPPGLGYYSYARAGWLVLALNSEISTSLGSAQLSWLRATLEAQPRACSLAYWHRPRFSSGPHGDAPDLTALWRTLYEAGVDVVLAGHDHLYERFAPMDEDGRLDHARGIRQFTVGTGGAFLYDFVRVRANSEARASVWGVLKLTLRATGYDWQFVPAAGASLTDSGSGDCH